MQAWLTIVLVVQLLSALAMIGLVLVQQGKGADMGASFGGGSSGSLFGASGSANFLSRSTAACATVFFVCTLALAYLGNSPASRSGSAAPSVLERSAPAAASAPAGVPAAIPGVPASPSGAAPGMPATPSGAAPGVPGVPAPVTAPAQGAASVPR